MFFFTIKWGSRESSKQKEIFSSIWHGKCFRSHSDLENCQSKNCTMSKNENIKDYLLKGGNHEFETAIKLKLIISCLRGAIKH